MVPDCPAMTSSGSRSCSVSNCKLPHFKQGYCVDHYRTYKDQPAPAAASSSSESDTKAKEKELSAYDASGKLKSYDTLARELLLTYAHLNREEILDLKTRFKSYDEDGDGVLNFHEVCQMLEKLGQTKTNAEAREIFKEADLDGNGLVDFVEFVLCMKPKPGSKQKGLGRIYQGALGKKASFFEDEIAKQNKEKDAAEIRQMRKKEEREAKAAEEAKKKEQAAKRAAFLAKNKAAFEGGAGSS